MIDEREIARKILSRDEVKLNLDEVKDYLFGKTVLVTGAGGTIGGELSRQIATMPVKKLILVDFYENTTYFLEREITANNPSLNLKVVIANVGDKKKMTEIFKGDKVDIVFNAFAHKHVPLMESSPDQAVKNNVFAFLEFVKLADKFKVETFLQISTDKAINPTSVMGATKLIGEMIVRSFAKKSKTKFVAVRFGNVLGSNGSVIPLFIKQIKDGSPITVTDKRVERYFMTVDEAVSLVLITSTFARSGEIYLLDMGKSVNIYEMAKKLVGVLGVDTPIVEIGLRKGEKLFEELTYSDETVSKTVNERVFVTKNLKPIERGFYRKLNALKRSAMKNSPSIKEKIKKICSYTELD